MQRNSSNFARRSSSYQRTQEEDNVREYFFLQISIDELIGSGFKQHIIQWRV
jgi:hypothetical protein